MRLAGTTFVLVVVLTTSAAIAVAFWDGRLGHRDSGSGVRAIHYDTNYSISSQRRGGPTE